MLSNMCLYVDTNVFDTCQSLSSRCGNILSLSQMHEYQYLPFYEHGCPASFRAQSINLPKNHAIDANTGDERQD